MVVINIQRMNYSKSPQGLHCIFDLILLFLDINVSYHWKTLFNRFHKILFNESLVKVCLFCFTQYGMFALLSAMYT